MATMDFKNPPKENDYPQCPTGVFNSVCVDVVDRGHKTTTYKGKTTTKPKVMLVFQTEDRNDLGYRHKLYVVMPVSTHPKSFMVKTLMSWMGEELKNEAFDPETLVGRGAQINVTCDTDEEDPFPEVTGVFPKHKHDNAIEAEDYTRYKDRPDWVEPTPSCWESATPAAATPQPAATAPATTQAPAQATLPTTEAAPPDVTPQPKAVPTKTAASQQPATEEELDKFMLFAMDLFDDDKAMGFIQEAAMKITKQDDIRQLTSNQLYQAKMELRNRKPTDFKVKKLEIPKAPPLTPEQIADGLGDDPFADEDED